MNGITVSVLMALLLIQASKTGVVGFQCTATSPAQTNEVFSSEPKIPMIHIFCGQIKGDKAEGFHGAPDGKPQSKDSTEIRPNTVFPKSDNNISCCDSCDIRVRKKVGNIDTWIPKNKPQAQCFFRWSIADTIGHGKAYNGINRGFVKGDTLRASTLINHPSHGRLRRGVAYLVEPRGDSTLPLAPGQFSGCGPTTLHDLIMVVASLVTSKSSLRYPWSQAGLTGGPAPLSYA
ncbi:hypothetical protein EMCRGX_G023997 [Ephydatia muelleri]